MEPLVDVETDAIAGGIDDTAAPRRDTPLPSDSVPWPELVRTVHRYMRSIVGPSRDLEDLSQAALEQLVRGLPHFQGRAQLSTFTYRVCAHVAMNHWRWWRRWLRRFQPGTEEVKEPALAEDDLPARLVESERARRLHAALSELAPTKRLCITLADFEELPASRIAEILECPEPTVRSRLRQARLELSSRLKKDPFFESDDDGEGGAR
jgi:RNA polymerase sigma-70 factor (ECF subfamily)